MGFRPRIELNDIAAVGDELDEPALSNRRRWHAAEHRQLPERQVHLRRLTHCSGSRRGEAGRSPAPFPDEGSLCPPRTFSFSPAPETGTPNGSVNCSVNAAPGSPSSTISTSRPGPISNWPTRAGGSNGACCAPETETVDLTALTALWWRRPQPPAPHPELIDSGRRRLRRAGEPHPDVGPVGAPAVPPGARDRVGVPAKAGRSRRRS